MRVDYALALMGIGIFDWIINQNRNIRFEMVPFDSENIDGMLYVPRIKRKRSCVCNVTE